MKTCIGFDSYGEPNPYKCHWVCLHEHSGDDNIPAFCEKLNQDGSVKSEWLNDEFTCCCCSQCCSCGW